jgi:hypothetical protein
MTGAVITGMTTRSFLRRDSARAAPNGPNDVQRAFAYTLLEAAVEIEVDLATGQSRALAFNGVPLARPTDWGL